MSATWHEKPPGEDVAVYPVTRPLDTGVALTPVGSVPLSEVAPLVPYFDVAVTYTSPIVHCPGS